MASGARVMACIAQEPTLVARVHIVHVMPCRAGLMDEETDVLAELVPWSSICISALSLVAVTGL